MINLPQEITTPRLKLIIPRAGLGEKLHAAIQDGYSDYVKWLNWPKALPTPQMVEQECRKHHADFILSEFIRYLIMERETDEIIGRCAFPAFQAHWSIPQFGISYFMRTSKRSQGYATEAVHAMCLLALKVLQARKLEVHCDALNLASTKIPLKLGFQLEYCQKGSWVRDNGQLADLQTYALFSQEALPKGDICW
jgi:RimJ/RimL family protein N-acetyltransferase